MGSTLLNVDVLIKESSVVELGLTEGNGCADGLPAVSSEVTAEPVGLTVFVEVADCTADVESDVNLLSGTVVCLVVFELAVVLTASPARVSVTSVVMCVVVCVVTVSAYVTDDDGEVDAVCEVFILVVLLLVLVFELCGFVVLVLVLVFDDLGPLMVTVVEGFSDNDRVTVTADLVDFDEVVDELLTDNVDVWDDCVLNATAPKATPLCGVEVEPTTPSVEYTVTVVAPAEEVAAEALCEAAIALATDETIPPDTDTEDVRLSVQVVELSTALAMAVDCADANAGDVLASAVDETHPLTGDPDTICCVDHVVYVAVLIMVMVPLIEYISSVYRYATRTSPLLASHTVSIACQSVVALASPVHDTGEVEPDCPVSAAWSS